MSTQIQLSSQIQARSCTFFEGRYEHLRVLGRGSYGEVSLAVHVETGRKVAIKVIKRSSFKSKNQETYACNELAVFQGFAKGLGHKNIVDYYDVHSDASSIYIVMEHVKGGDLSKPIKQRGRIGEPEVWRLLKQLLEAVHHLHDNGIAHRDLKPENVLLDDSNNIRLCDFGFGCICANDKLLETYCGTPFYAAPEIVSATPYKPFPMDMWSCGVILFTLLTGWLPFHSPSYDELFESIRQVRYDMPLSVSFEATDWISKILVKDPDTRLTAKECLKHPWLAKISDGSIMSSDAYQENTSFATETYSAIHSTKVPQGVQVESMMVLANDNSRVFLPKTFFCGMSKKVGTAPFMKSNTKSPKDQKPEADGAKFASRVEKMMNKVFHKMRVTSHRQPS